MKIYPDDLFLPCRTLVLSLYDYSFLDIKMDYLGAEISKKIKSAIRAKLVELGVYVGE